MTQTLQTSHNMREYQALVELLDELIDQVGGDETHPLASLIERYEDEHVPELAETHD